MKKIFTLAIAGLLTLPMFAADRKPSVTLTTSKKFEVVIDGRSYGSAIGSTMNVSNMYNGRHTIKVYALKNGLFSKQKRLISTSGFQLNRADVDISVDRNGQISIHEENNFGRDNGYDKNKNDKGRNDNGRNDHDRNDTRHDKGRF